MRKLILIAVIALSACTPQLATVGDAPGAMGGMSMGSIADNTKLDEQAVITAELGYKAWRQVITLGVQSGFIKGKLAGQLANADNDLYAALTGVQDAYELGNATSLKLALASFNAALKNANGLVGSK
jgi:hypothetical protein